MVHKIAVVTMCIAVSVVFSDLAFGGEYSEDFSAAPGWTTNAPGLFNWNSGAGTYAATQVNVNGGGNYSYYDVGPVGASFSLEWDINLSSVDYASGLTFGVFDTDLDSQTASYAKVEFTRADQGKFAVLGYIDASGTNSHSDYISTPPAQFSLDTWYHVNMQYNEFAGTLSADITERSTGSPFTSLSLSGLASLRSDVAYVGSSNVRTGNFQVPGAQTVGHFDNVGFTPKADAYYLLNNNANDATGNGYHGTVTGATPIADRFGDPSSALSLDGNDHIEIPSSPEANTYVDFSAWVRLDEEGGRDGGYILCKGKYLVPETYSIAVNDTTHIPQVNVHVGGNYYNAVGAAGLELGEWTHIRGVYDGVGPSAGLTLYVDGSIADSVPVSGALDQNSESLWFGVDYGNSLVAWEGSIDDVSIIVPEPATLTLLAISGLAVLRRRRE
jgi:hypothetical protein